MLCASCSVQIALCKLLPASCSVQVALRKLLCASCSRQGALRKLVCASCSAQVALRKLVCATCSASCSAQVALCKLLRAACEARPRTRGESNPGSAGPGSRRANHETTPEDQLEPNKTSKTPRAFAPRPRRSPQRVARAKTKSHKNPSFCTSTTPIPAEGRAGPSKIAQQLEFLDLDHANPRRGSRGRPRRSPQRVARAPQRVDFRRASSALPRRPKKRF